MEIEDALSVCEGEGTPFKLGWLSPSNSFSKDLAMLDRGSPEKRKRDDEIGDDFQFLPTSNTTLDLLQFDHTMSSADELFFDGKLRPVYLPRRKASLDVLPWPPLHEEAQEEEEEEERSCSNSRHLGYESSCRCASMSFGNARDTTRRSSISLNSSRCPSPSRVSSSIYPPTTMLPKAVKPTFNRVKDFFKFPKMHLPTTTTNKGVSAKSFWPFSRSNSAGEKKTCMPHPVPPRRSNSAGDRKTSTSTLIPSKNQAVAETINIDEKKTFFPYAKDLNISLPPEDMDGKAINLSSSSTGSTGDIRSRVLGASVLPPPLTTYVPPAVGAYNSLLPRAEVVDITSCVQGHVKQIDRHRDIRRSVDATAGCSSTKTKGTVIPGRVQRRGLSSPARNFARASPGRRGVWNSPGRGGSTRVVARNFERRCDGTNFLERSRDLRNTCKGPSDRSKSHSVVVRVSPILNVPVCMGPSVTGRQSSKNRLFNFPGLFSKKKPSKVCSTAPNNWKNGG